MQRKKFTFKKINKLKSKKSFQFVYGKGRTVVDPLSVFYILADQGEDVKIGLAVGKKLGCAVVRNRVKRLLRESYRKNQSMIRPGLALLLVGRKAMVDVKCDVVEKSFVSLGHKAGIFLDPADPDRKKDKG